MISNLIRFEKIFHMDLENKSANLVLEENPCYDRYYFPDRQ